MQSLEALLQQYLRNSNGKGGPPTRKAGSTVHRITQAQMIIFFHVRQEIRSLSVIHFKVRLMMSWHRFHDSSAAVTVGI